ncbi:UDP-2,4-diacetamido-2,4,6-trideoxy-beta-L-altropyranose hydrolase [Noviherbaspirillum saxi]|uniref:UDP-2,4-diacetamido-2,4, 6-trideoxy-beta-L-altropyranose hydrolase n=1 Tax=Noviherbaspirillum saxi TaxID=2320863 RepID=A0A3A3FSX9_9BURK|nr:UDP-2,4-diacetamido-2,4,6-trideoxy-beta-L-altropyranose hydrolase [Noviherbaspirillum saxi]RJF98620.1 UDP-2,4-diacetamido-2,4,6-trideoxy-beta-L-altropyranose hydrolase [Noviherbaspirillum saxi]
MNIGIRTDSSTAIGTGHVMRCLTLADALRAAGARVVFACRDLPGNLNAYISSKGYAVHTLAGIENLVWEEDAAHMKALLASEPTAPDWLIVDHYALDARWESAIRPSVGRIMVIDDLANRRHDCDLLLDQNFYPDAELRYRALVPPHGTQLLGPRHALLRPEFNDAARYRKKRDGAISQIFIFFGGSDPTNETEKALCAIRKLDRADLHLDVVVGNANPNRDRIEALCAQIPNAAFHCQIANIATLMTRADLAIGAGGASTWERCYLGLPALTIIVADNQAETTRALADIGAVWNLGTADTVTADAIACALDEILSDSDAVCGKSRAALRVMGVADDRPVDASAADAIAARLFAMLNDLRLIEVNT